MKLAGLASKMSEPNQTSSHSSSEDVVEIGILLPANRAADLIRIAQSRQESVGHMIRKLIDTELATARQLR